MAVPISQGNEPLGATARWRAPEPLQGMPQGHVHVCLTPLLDGIQSVEDWRLRVQKATGANFCKIETADGRTLDGYAVPPRGLDNNACAILFHANAMICLDMALWAKWYRSVIHRHCTCTCATPTCIYY